MAGVIVILLILLIGGFYIYTVGKLGKLHDSARNAAGELDTLLWDRNHVLNQLIGKIEEKGIRVPEEHKEPIALALGMNSTMQMTVFTQLMRRGEAVQSIIGSDEGLSDDAEMKKLSDRYVRLRDDIAEAGSRYNQRANAFNSFIRMPLAGFLAARKGMGTRGFFSIQIAEAAK